MKILSAALFAATLTLAACGGNEGAEQAADQLDNAAEQSDPAAAQVLENAAEQVRETGSPAAARNVLEQAGNAQAPTVPPPAKGALPTEPGNTGQAGAVVTNAQ